MILFATYVKGGQPVEVDIAKIGVVYPDDDVIYFDGLPYRLSSLYSADKSVADQQSERLNELADVIRTAVGQLQRGWPHDARETLQRGAMHYPTCAWWEEGTCDCGGWA